MSDDDNNDSDDERSAIPSTSRLSRGGPRRYRMLSRTSERNGFRFQRHRRQLPIAELLGVLLKRHGLTDKVRERIICLYWPEIAGERIAPKTWPVSLSEGVLQVSVINSSWVHEMTFHKAQLIARVHDWLEANRVWLGSGRLITDMRFGLDLHHREPLVDREHARRLRSRQWRRLRRPPELAPPTISDTERDAILAETSTIADAEVRAMIESVRIKWNR